LKPERILTRNNNAVWEISVTKAKGRWNGIYALNLYHPVATLAHSWRRRGRVLRGKTTRHEQPTRLPQVAWSEAFERHKIYLTETDKRSGNVSLGELAVLAQAAAGTPAGSEIIEIGTFDGRTTINLAINAPSNCAIFTLDLPPHHPTQFQLDVGEELYVKKPLPGERFRRCGESWSSSVRRIAQIFGDSATFDWSSHYGKAGLVFVDASHAYDYVQNDSETAMRLVTDTGTVLWHDYGVWEGVTRGLEELEQTRNLGLQHVRGTSLVLWRAFGR
jgi:Methyltransferase domain